MGKKRQRGRRRTRENRKCPEHDFKAMLVRPDDPDFIEDGFIKRRYYCRKCGYQRISTITKDTDKGRIAAEQSRIRADSAAKEKAR